MHGLFFVCDFRKGANVPMKRTTTLRTYIVVELVEIAGQTVANVTPATSRDETQVHS